MTRLEQLDERYREHHRTSRSSEFVFGGADRAGRIAEAVGGPGRRVLDLGCRYGALTRWYLDGNDVVGMDVDREALAEAAKLGIETHWGDVEEAFPFPDASFDVVVAGELLEHVREPGAVVGEARRVLRPGGRLVASVPNAFRFKNRVRFALGRRPETDPTHLHIFRPDDVRALLRGWDDVELEFVVGRFVRLHARLMANDIVFSARKPL